MFKYIGIGALIIAGTFGLVKASQSFFIWIEANDDIEAPLDYEEENI